MDERVREARKKLYMYNTLRDLCHAVGCGFIPMSCWDGSRFDGVIFDDMSGGDGAASYEAMFCAGRDTVVSYRSYLAIYDIHCEVRAVRDDGCCWLAICFEDGLVAVAADGWRFYKGRFCMLFSGEGCF